MMHNNLKKQKTTKKFGILPQDVLFIIFEYWSIPYRFRVIRTINKNLFNKIVCHDYFWQYKKSQFYNTAKSLYMLIKKYGGIFKLGNQYHHILKLTVFEQLVKQTPKFEDLWKILHDDALWSKNSGKKELQPYRNIINSCKHKRKDKSCSCLTNKYEFFYFLFKEFNELPILKLKQSDDTHLEKLKFWLREHTMHYVLATNPKDYPSLILGIHNMEFDVLSWNKKTYDKVINILKKKKKKLNTIRFPFLFKGFDYQMSDDKIFESIAKPLLNIDLTNISSHKSILEYETQILKIINNRLKQIAEFIGKNTTVLIYPHAAFKFVYKHCDLSPIIEKMRITNTSYCEIINPWKMSKNKLKNNEVTTVKGSGNHLNSQNSIHILKKYFKNLNKIIVKHGRYSDIAKILKSALAEGIDTVEFLYISSNLPKKNFSSMLHMLSNIIKDFFVKKKGKYHSKKPFKIILENNFVIRSAREKEIIKILKKFNDDFNKLLKDPSKVTNILKTYEQTPKKPKKKKKKLKANKTNLMQKQETPPNQRNFNNSTSNCYIPHNNIPNETVNVPEQNIFYNQHESFNNFLLNHGYTPLDQIPQQYMPYNQHNVCYNLIPNQHNYYNQYTYNNINITQQIQSYQTSNMNNSNINKFFNNTKKKKAKKKIKENNLTTHENPNHFMRDNSTNSHFFTSQLSNMQNTNMHEKTSNGINDFNYIKF